MNCTAPHPCSCDHCRLIRIEHKLDILLHGDEAVVASLIAQLKAARTPLAAAIAAAPPAS